MLKKLDHLKDAQDYIIKGALFSPFNHICLMLKLFFLFIHLTNVCVPIYKRVAFS